MYTVCRQYRHTYLYVHNALLQFQGVNQWNSLQPRMVCSFKKATFMGIPGIPEAFGPNLMFIQKMK